MKRILLTLLLLFIVLIGLLFFRFGTALTQEGNPLPILSSIFVLDFSDSEYEPFVESEAGTRFVSANTGESRYDVVEDLMNENGWEFMEQLGSGLVFQREAETMIVETRQFTKHYFLWDVPGGVLAD